MKQKSVLAFGAAFALVAALAGCASSNSDKPIGGDVITPVVMDANDLQGATVELVVGQVLDINTGDLAADSYTGEVADPTIAEFTAGKVDGSTVANPAVEGLAPGTTGVIMTNDQGGIQPLEFTVTVTE